MRAWSLSKVNIYSVFAILCLVATLLLSVISPLAFFKVFDVKSLNKLLQPAYLECVATLKDGEVALKVARETCQENSVRQLLQKMAFFIFASPVILLNVRKEVFESPKSRAQRLGATGVVNALERMEQIANMACLFAVPLAVVLLVQSVQAFDMTVFGHTIGKVLLAAGVALSLYVAALLTALIATGLMPSDPPPPPGPTHPGANTPPSVGLPQGPTGTSQTPQGQAAPGSSGNRP